MDTPHKKNETVQEMWDRAFQHTRNHVREHHLNHAYLEGYQWMDWHPVELQVQALPDDQDRIQATMNHMRANVRTIISQLTQRELSFEVPASAYDDATLRAAKIAEGDLRDVKRKHRWESLREGVVKAALKGGTGIVAVEYSAKNKDTKETVLGVPEFVVEPGAREALTARWWIKLQLLPPDEVQAMFPKQFKKNPPQADGRLGMATEFEYRYKDDVPLTRVYTYYERPGPLNEKGTFKVEVNGNIMDYGDWPFPFTDRLNFGIMRESLIENDAFGTTILSDARSPQTALNAAWSSFLEHMRDVGSTRMIFDESWEDAVQHLTDRPGEPLVGPIAKGKPEYAKPPGAPTILLDGITMLQNVLDNLLGVHDVSRGSAPANIESGYGLSILAEKDSSPVGRLIKETAALFSDVAWMRLEIIQKEQANTKRTTTISDGQGPVMREWKGKDLMGQTGAVVPLDAIVPRSQAAQQQFAMQAVEMGMVNPEDPLAVMRFAKLADMPDQRGIINATIPAASKAIRENESVVMDEIPFPREFDNHEMHVQIHNDFRMSAQYELMTNEQREAIDDHIVAHEKMAQEALGKARKGQAIDPAMAEIPTAEGQPAPMPLPPQELPPEMPMEAAQVPPEQAAGDIMAALENL